MKKVIAREFLWLLATIVLAYPLAYVFLEAMNIISQRDSFSIYEKIFIDELFIVAYIFNFIGVYIIRLVVVAIKTLAAS
jgi:hypothetical protein